MLFLKVSSSKFYIHHIYVYICIIVIFQKAKKKPLVTKKPSDYGVDITPRHEVVSVEDPPVRQAGQKVESVEELVTKLKEAGLV